ncbi:MAG: ATP-binding protein [Anaerolineaceae bacterium]|nr:ATP-binding protein [Anaerolineaceae bacterium]
MRLRLIISFALIIFVALGTVMVVINLTAEQQVRGYLRNGSLSGVEKLVEDLSDHYESISDWEGVSSVFVSETTPQSEFPGAGGASGSTDPEIQPGNYPGIGEGPGPGNGKGSSSGNGSGGEDQRKNNTEPQQIETPLSVPPVTVEPAAIALPTETQSFEDTPSTEADTLVSLEEPVYGKAGHILTDETGLIVYSPVESEIGLTIDQDQLLNAVAILDGQTVVGFLIPSGGTPNLPANFEAQLVDRIQNATLIAAMISGGIAIILAMILAQMILKPVKVLTQAANRLSEGDLDQRVHIKGKSEVADLGNTFNQMAYSLQEAEKQRRAMTADIAHELRTPLAVQQANLEALQDGVYPLTQSNLNPIIEQNRLLTRLVDDLRTLALADAGELSLNRRPVNLPELCAEISIRFEASLSSSGIQIKQEAESGLPPVYIDPERIEQILHNLLQNAQRYSSDNSILNLRILKRGNMAVVELRDHGPGIPENELGNIFERFYRVGKGRDRKMGGTGLGLAIARQLAEAHGGSLTATNHPAGGAVFTLQLPFYER